MLVSQLPPTANSDSLNVLAMEALHQRLRKEGSLILVEYDTNLEMLKFPRVELETKCRLSSHMRIESHSGVASVCTPSDCAVDCESSLSVHFG